jgi:hypothetical protein
MLVSAKANIFLNSTVLAPNALITETPATVSANSEYSGDRVTELSLLISLEV